VEYYSPPESSPFQLIPNHTVAPNFSLLNLNGDTVTLEELKGKLVLIDFWYTSCYPCVKAMPYLEDLHQKYKNKGLVVLGINPVDTNDLSEFLNFNGISYSMVLGNSNVVEAYSVSSYPSLYLIDKTGEIIFSEIGFDDNTASTLDSLIGFGLTQGKS